MEITPFSLIEQTIIFSEPIDLELALKSADRFVIGRFVAAPRKKFQPDRVQLEAFQSQHPLQRNGKDSTALAILRRKAAAEENCHTMRIARRWRHSSELKSGGRSFDVLEHALAAVRPDLLWTIAVHPWCDPPRDDPPFGASVDAPFFLRKLALSLRP